MYRKYLRQYYIERMTKEHIRRDCKEIQPVHPNKDQSWVFTGRTDTETETPIIWPPHAKS